VEARKRKAATPESREVRVPSTDKSPEQGATALFCPKE